MMVLFIMTKETGARWDLPEAPLGWLWLGSGGTGWDHAPIEYQFIAKDGDGDDEQQENGAASTQEAAEYLRKEMRSILDADSSPVIQFHVHEGTFPVVPIPEEEFEKGNGN
jgi:hypothetical protein